MRRHYISLPLKLGIVACAALAVVSAFNGNLLLSIMSAVAALVTWRLGVVAVQTMGIIDKCLEASSVIERQSNFILLQGNLINDQRAALDKEVALRLAQQARYEAWKTNAESIVGQAEMVRAGRR